MAIQKYGTRPCVTLATSEKIDIQTRKLYLEVVLLKFDSDETSWHLDAAVLRGISIPIVRVWFGLEAILMNLLVFT